jgi:dihydroflavonol-4-reductase
MDYRRWTTDFFQVIDMARTLVLGATGHIGAHVVRALLAEGHHVRAAYRNGRFLSVLQGLPVERVAVDLETLNGLHAALEGCEWVFHAAGYYPTFRARRESAIAQGLTSTRRILAAIASTRPQRVVFTSSVATIRRVPDRLANEADREPWPLPSWRSLYATVKIGMEHEALRAAREGLPIVIVNPSLCLGEYDAHPSSGQAILAYAKHRLPFYVHHTFNVVYTGDVAIGHLRAAERGRVGERYLLTCRNVTLHEFTQLVASCAGVPPPRWRIPYRMAWLAALGTELGAWVSRREPWLPRAAVHSVRMGQRLDGTKAVRELGLPQTPIEEAVRRALAWFREAGFL